ncbi:MAG: electron transport complex subunit RsxB [Halothiobacillus sp. 14-56-357]|jgi:electron transport complex protein RnfB|uniref:electron transport complex subunit RsxB n=1 Tax=Halothiobacillus sp. 15-55-196 TaxID=1970382 RepID=UPI000BD4969C|nr:electron transport complex subunit RsxB [Halothiobacillus sp. 15-55-196]OZB37447.1 MAG: electron transport complex subunit RsxB [Halothiobacillus sp. 15-55-196]OZB56716.1 MAG: electron transport complex subunit RsxB [Halothiobacillus sp. 14-56-357]OZB78748.1 MAG: electron transport complex subunit RsxB [Halothiobacillus sp. 13-55-115]
MLTAILVAAGLTLAFGIVLGVAAQWFHVEGNPLAEKIDAILPQTQCGQCGFTGCKPYAEAIAKGEADINQCPPGGETTIKSLADLLGVESKPLNAENGEAKAVPFLAVIDESVCIGCTKCIQACPVDAILGAAKQMHTVIAAECTGCALCVAPCPVDCIDMVPLDVGLAGFRFPEPKWIAPQSAGVPEVQHV